MEHKDKRIDIIMNKMGLSLEIAQWAIGLHKKYAIWAANQVKNNPSLFPAKCGDFETIIDWKKEQHAINLNELSFNTALRRARAFNKQKENPFKTITGSLKNQNIVLDLGDYKWVELKTEEDCREEGDAMKHCIGGYRPSENHQLFSLRDKFNVPHLSISIQNNNLNQYKGKSNSQPKEQYLIPFLKLISNYKLEKVHDQYFWNSIRSKPEYIEMLDKTHAHLISFSERIRQGLGVSDKFIYYNESVNQKIEIAEGQTFSLPDGFRLLGDFIVTMQRYNSTIKIGDGAIFSDDLSLTGESIYLGNNIKVGGNLTIEGGLDNLPENLRVCGNVKIYLTNKKHKQSDLYNALEKIWLGGYLDIEIISTEKIEK